MPSPHSEPVTIEKRLAERNPPPSPVVMYQRWQELLFLHWSIDPDTIAPTLPPGLSVDTFDGRAWIGVVPFHMRDVRPRFLPALPGVSNFTELNLRTYVFDRHGRPGVWFYSLDTTHHLANWVARRFFNLNYQLATMASEKSADSWINYQSKRRSTDDSGILQSYRWKREGRIFTAKPATLEFFLAERYRLFAYNPESQQLFTGKVSHAPYPLQRAELAGYSTELFTLNGFEAPAAAPDSILATAGVAVRIHPMEHVD